MGGEPSPSPQPSSSGEGGGPAPSPGQHRESPQPLITLQDPTLTCFSAADSSARNTSWVPLETPLRPRSRELFPTRTAFWRRSNFHGNKTEKTVFVPPEPTASRLSPADPRLCSPAAAESAALPRGCRRRRTAATRMHLGCHCPRALHWLPEFTRIPVCSSVVKFGICDPRKNPRAALFAVRLRDCDVSPAAGPV